MHEDKAMRLAERRLREIRFERICSYYRKRYDDMADLDIEVNIHNLIFEAAKQRLAAEREAMKEAS